VACDAAAYDSTASIEGIPGLTVCMANAWLSVAGGGPAFLGNTREGLYGFESSVLEKYFLQQIFVGGNARIGQAEAASKSVYGTANDGLFLAESHNLFGDPSMIVRTAVSSGSIARGGNLGQDQTTSTGLPKEFGLSQNYPNPFNPSTTIKFALPIDSHVVMKAYDVLGREVTTLIDSYLNAGYHIVTFDGARLSSGVYFCKMDASNFVSVKKLVVVR